MLFPSLVYCSTTEQVLTKNATNFRIIDHFIWQSAGNPLGIIDFLLDNGAVIDARDHGDPTPLMIGITEDSLENRRLLLARGADVNLLDVDGDGLFNLAVLEIKNALLAGLLLKYDVDMNARNKFRGSALHLAAIRGQADSANLLIDCGIHIIATNVQGKKALHLASRWAEEEIAKIFIVSAADVNVTKVYGRKALLTAIKGGHIKIVKLPIRTHTKIDQQNVNGDIVLSVAALHGEEALVDLLLDADAQIVPQDPGPHCPFLDPEEMVSGCGQDAVLAALEKEHFGVTRMIMKFAGGRNNGANMQRH